MLGSGGILLEKIHKDKDKSTYSSSFSSNTSSVKSFGNEQKSEAPNSSIFGEKDEDIYENVVRKCSADTTHDISDIETDEDDQEDAKLK